MSKITYRTDIDGLRAVAVLAVLFDHLGIGLFHGGYIGVDIFFVISGYLITDIIVREMEANEFSLIRFYERRIRRIYPALFITLLFTVIAGSLLYNKVTLHNLGGSVVATTFFYSNIHFWKEVGYFDNPAQLKPLLHTWSLAVEEQFYIVFPLLMLALARLSKSKTPYILGILALVSFGWNIYVLQSDPDGAFYFAHLRAWELLIGGLLSIYFIHFKTAEVVNNILAWIGLGMVTAPIFLYSPVTAFPGVAAAIPAVGTAMIIFTGKDNPPFINKLLGIAPLAFIGKISYSLYLWHWPIIVFSQYYAIKKLTIPELAGITFFTIAAAILSWKFIETPFRQKRKINSRNTFKYAASAMIVATLIGTSLYNQNAPIPASKPQERTSSCNLIQSNKKPSKRIKTCPLGVRDQPPIFLLWGDSHARALADGISIAAKEQNIKGELVWAPGCPPLLDILTGPKNQASACNQAKNLTMAYITKHTEIKTIILAGRWANWAQGSRYELSDQSVILYIQDSRSKSNQPESSIKLFERGLERTVKKLLELDRNVVIISQIPEIGYNVPQANFIASRTNRDTNEIIGLSLENFFERSGSGLSVIKNISDKYNLEVIDPWRVICDSNTCLPVSGNHLIYKDSNHLSPFGSKFIKKIYEPLFQKLSQNK